MKIAAHSAYEMFSWYKYLIVSLVFSHFGFWSGNLFLIAPFPDLCLLVPFNFDRIFFIFESNKGSHNISNVFEFQPGSTIDCRVICP